MNRLSSLVMAALYFTAGCEQGRHADRQIQLCLKNDEGLATFEKILRAKSGEYNLVFYDSSAETEQGLAEVGSDLAGDYPIRHFHAHDKADGFEVTASNLGLGRYQTTMSYDLRSDRQRAFASEIEQELARHFAIVMPEEGKGALPLRDCPD